MSIRTVFVAIFALMALAAFMLVVLTVDVRAHEATPTAAQPLGWKYPGSCCSGIDCREVTDTAIIEGARGYEIVATGEIIPMTSPMVKESPDGQFHWCSQGGKPDGKTICLFVPPRGF